MTLDTRSKIVDAARLGEFAEAVFVAAYLDPLSAEHARRLEVLAEGRPLVVLLLDPPQPLLAAEARAELAASLACVTAVVRDGSTALAALPPGRVLREEAADLARREALMRHVHARHASA